MSKKARNIILIIFGFLLSLFIFELFFGCGGMDDATRYAEQTGNSSPFVVFVPFVEAGIYHAIFIGIIAVMLRFTKIDKTYKKIIAYLPVYSIVLIIPMMCLL